MLNMLADPATVRIAVVVVAVTTFVLFLIFLYLPRLTRVTALREDFFKNPTALLETAAFTLIYAVLFGVLFGFPQSAVSPNWVYPGGGARYHWSRTSICRTILASKRLAASYCCRDAEDASYIGHF